MGNTYDVSHSKRMEEKYKRMEENDRKMIENEKREKETNMETFCLLYKNKNYKQCVEFIDSHLMDLKLIEITLRDCSDEALIYFANNLNTFIMLRIFYCNSIMNDINRKRTEFILKTNIQKYLWPTIKLLPIEYTQFLLDQKVKIYYKHLLFTIEHNKSDIFYLLLDKPVLKKNEKKDENEIKNDLNKSFLKYSIIYKNRDTALFLINKIGLKNVDIDPLNKIANKEMKPFLDEILKQKISLLS